MFGAILWTQSVGSLALSLLILAIQGVGVFALWAKPASDTVVAFVTGRFELQAAALFTAGTAATVLGLIRLARVSEDRPNYQFLKLWMRPGRGAKFDMSDWQWAGIETTERGRRHRLEERSFARLTEHAHRASASRWSRVCRWQVMPIHGRSNWVFGLGAFLSYLLTTWAIGKESETYLLPVVSIVFPVVPMVQYAKRKFGRDLLMPVDRAAFVRQFGTAAALDQIQFWARMSVGLILWWLWAAPDQLPPVVMVNLLACSALCQVGLFGLGIWGVWFAQRYGLQVVIMPLAIAGGLSVPIVMITMDQTLPDWWVSTLPVAAGLFALCGVLIAWAGYRRWLVTDLD